MNPKVSIILVNYNGNEDTIACVSSLQEVDYDNYEIIVVDNASKNQDELGEKMSSDVVLIKSDKNLGFSGGNNLGIEYAMKSNADYVMLLNNDTVVDKNLLKELIKSAEEHAPAGIITGKILYYSEPDRVWYAGGYMNLNKARIHHCHIQENDTFDDCEREVSFATGCLVMMPKEVIQKIGMLNDIFFMYSEDAEYCARVQNAGYKIWYTPEAKIYHKISASSGGAGSRLSQYYRARNELYLVYHYAKHPVIGSACCIGRYLKRIIVGQFTITCTIAGISDFCKEKMGRTDRQLNR